MLWRKIVVLPLFVQSTGSMCQWQGKCMTRVVHVLKEYEKGETVCCVMLFRIAKQDEEGTDSVNDQVMPLFHWQEHLLLCQNLGLC